MKVQNDNPLLSHRIYNEIKDFILDRKAQHLSKWTVKIYEDTLATFNDWAKAQDVEFVEQITAATIRQYLIALEDNHNAGGVHIYWRTIKTFMLWYEHEYEPEGWRNPIRKVVPPQNRLDPIPGIPMVDINAMIDVCDTHTLAGARDQAIIRTLVDTGVRRAEFCAMRIMDVNMETGEIHVIKGKGNKGRAVFVGPTTRRDIMRYMRFRSSKDPRDWLWVTPANTQLTYAGLRQILRRRAIEANVADPSPHDFRRTFAIECLKNGIDLIQLMRLMGHTSTTVLQRYLALQSDDLMTAHKNFGPVDKHNRDR